MGLFGSTSTTTCFHQRGKRGGTTIVAYQPVAMIKRLTANQIVKKSNRLSINSHAYRSEYIRATVSLSEENEVIFLNFRLNKEMRD